MYPELKKALQFIVEKLKALQLANSFSLLSQEYDKILSAPSPEVDKQINALTETIYTSQAELEPSYFDNRAMQVLRKFDTQNVLGSVGIDTFNKVLKSINNNPHAVSVALADIANKITATQERAQQALTSLSDVWGPDVQEKSKKTEIQIIFDDKVSIENIEGLVQQAKFWEENLKLAKNMLADGKEEPQIVSIYKSSPTEIILRGDWATLTMIGVTFNAVLFGIQKILDIIETRARIQKLNLESSHLKKIDAAFDDGLQDTINKQVASAVDSALSQLSDYVPKGAMKNAAVNAGLKLAENFYDFSNNGGSISIVNPGEKPKDAKVSDEVYHTLEKTRELADYKKKLNNPVLPKALISPVVAPKPKKEVKKKQKSVVTKKRQYTKKVKTPVVEEPPEMKPTTE